MSFVLCSPLYCTSVVKIKYDGRRMMDDAIAGRCGLLSLEEKRHMRICRDMQRYAEICGNMRKYSYC